jgi:hypothetical protein
MVSIPILSLRSKRQAQEGEAALRAIVLWTVMTSAAMGTRRNLIVMRPSGVD